LRRLKNEPLISPHPALSPRPRGEGRESKNERSSEVRTANIMLILTLRLIPPARNQKAEAKPVGNHRERSQGWAVMPSHDVASLPSWARSPLGRCRGRASPFRAKSAFSASKQRIRSASYTVTGALRHQGINHPFPQSGRASHREIQPGHSKARRNTSHRRGPPCGGPFVKWTLGFGGGCAA
jgi:hypothetical protein